MDKKTYKNTIIKALVLPVIPLLFYSGAWLFNPGAAPVMNPVQSGERDFINMIFNLDYFGMGTNSGASWSIRKHRSYYRDSLHFNAIQIYGGEQGGAFDQPIAEYKDDVLGLMSSVDSAGLRGYWGRSKIEKLCYSQRLEYEISEPPGNNTVNNGFCYQNTAGIAMTDSGRTVLYACTGNCGTSGPTQAGYIAQNIYENLQHNDLLDWQEGDGGNWYIKPVMRIKQSDFSPTSTTPVVVVVTKNYGGNTIDSVIIRVRNFGNGSYSGQYVYKYFELGNELTIQVSGGKSKGELAYGHSIYKDSCHVDFKIYWYGLVDLWLDKVIVDDKRANELFNNVHDDKVIEEVNEFTNHPVNYTFFADEMTYSNIKSVKYVYEKMKQTNSNAKLSCALTNYFNYNGFKRYNEDNAHRLFLNEIQPERFTCDAHEIYHFDNNGNYLPDGIFTGVTSYLVSPSWFKSYGTNTRQMQERVFGDKNSRTDETTYDNTGDKSFLPAPWGSLVYQVNLARERADELNPPAKVVMQPQIHGYIFKSPAGAIWGNREPLNEEIQAQAMLSISHGADGVCWFIYQSTKSVNNSLGPLQGSGGGGMGGYLLSSNDTNYCLGLLTVYPDDQDPGPRHVNVYGQDKWNYVAEMNLKIEKWKPTLDNIVWQSGWSVHSEGANHEYILDIMSIVPYMTGQNPCTNNYQTEGLAQGPYLDCPEERYWELGFFTPPGNTEDYSRYILITNRRCIPASAPGINPPYPGDKRVLRIKFNGSNLPGTFTTWKITDITMPKTSVQFLKSYNGYVDLNTTADSIGLFKPGEGKLFKLEPEI